MITGELKSKVDRIWDTMWSGGISNPLSVIEQLTYLLFIKRVDELHTLKEAKASRTGNPIEEPVFTEDQDNIRWSRFKELAPEQMFEIVRDGVFPFIKTLGQKGEAVDQGGSTYTHHMKDALFMMPTARVLANVVDQLDGIDMADSDTKGDLYEYMLGKIASAGQNGQFRTPRHIIKLMVDMTAPTPKDVICDPACGTAGFLIAASEFLVEHYSDSIYKDAAARRRFNEGTFHGYDFDSTMLRIGSMNMLLHGVENPDIRYKDSLAQADELEEEIYSLVLANPPFAGSLDYESTAKDLQQIVKTKKTELLFLALFLRLLQTGGRAAVIVPDGVLFGSSKAHKTLRKILVEEQKLDAIVSMPSGVFKPYAGVSTAILLFTKTNSGGTDHVWFYDMKADGFSLDDKRTPQPDKSDLADILARWQKRDDEGERARTDQSFLVPKSEIADNEYDLSINRYKEVEYEAVEHDPPKVILGRMAKLEEEIAHRREELENMLGVNDPLTNPVGWESRPLGELADNEDGNRIPVKKADRERMSGEFPYYGASGVIDYVDDYLFDGERLLIGEDGANLIARSTPVAFIAKGKYWVNNHAHVLAFNGSAELTYLEGVINAIDLKPYLSGTAQPKLNQKNLNRIPIPLPPLAEQKRIAGILDAADALRAKRRESLAQLDTLLQSTYLDMFGDPVNNPMGWGIAELRHHTSKVGSGATPRGGNDSYKAEGIALIRSMNVRDGEFQWKNLARIDEHQASKLANVVVEENDVLLNITGASVARVCRAPKDVLPAVVNQHVCIIRTTTSFEASFLERLLLADPMKSKLLGIGESGATRQAITKAQVLALAVPRPPLNLQHYFANIVKSIEHQKASQRAHLSELDTLFASLQSRAFCGDL